MKVAGSHIARFHVLATMCFSIFNGSVGLAQAEPADLTIELNKLRQTQRGCQLSFVATNGSAIPITKLALEIAFFKTDGLLEKLSVLDFRGLPAGKSKVRQFAVKEIKCADLGRILINGVAACESETPAPCHDDLKTINRSEIVFEA